MRIRAGCVALVLVLIAASSEAGLFKRGGGKYTPPKAASPLNQGGGEVHRLAIDRAKPEKYQRPEWGSLAKQSLRLKGSPTVGHYNEF